jgi:2-polyprenyl-3-methyl-5-hydroxy-6-metoxy-1,4-benzoquinol methylase
MEKYHKLISDHYTQTDLSTNIMTAFERAGRHIFSHEDTASFDEFHIRGRDATRELAKLAGVQKGMKVLDIGCGVGGPARTLAAEFGCIVNGIELVEEYYKAALMLTERVGLDHMVTFQNGDMMTLLFDEENYDVVWTEHTIMNIEEKMKLLYGVHGRLRPKGIFALYEICAGNASPVYFPLPWASDPGINFLVTQNELRQRILRSKFKELLWKDATSESLEWFQNRLASRPSKRVGAASSSLGLSLLMGQSAAEKGRNMLRNLVEDRITVVQGVFQRED